MDIEWLGAEGDLASAQKGVLTMQDVRRVVFAATVVALALALGAAPACAGYYYGFVWDRSADYDPGTTHGSSDGNPNTDTNGNPVWSLESTNAAGDGLGGANPWYQGATQLEVWDSSWYGGGPTWARGDNVNPGISPTSLTHNISNSSLHGNVPLVRWFSPVDESFSLQITGSLTENWRGGGGLSDNVDFDVAIAHFDASANTYDTLFGEVFEKPTDDQSWESLTKDVAVFATIEPGDQIIVSHRGQTPSPRGSTWPNLADDLIFTQTPEPATLTLLGLGALALLRRRR